MSPKRKPNEIHLSRIYDAPVSVVWDAWTDPDQAAKWWGPRGFTLTTHGKDLRPGGIWHYTMHGPDGTDYPNKTLYHEVVECQKLVYDHGASDEQDPLFRVTVTFEDLDGRTAMEMTMALATAEQAEQTRKFIKQAGGNATWDRLAEYLEQQSAQREIFVINRSFSTPAEGLFQMWHDPSQFSRWLGPVGSRMTFMENEVGEGRTASYRMSYGSGLVMFGKIHYVRIDAPHFLEYIQWFCDEEGNLAKHPNVPTWPDRIQTSVQFTPEAEGSRATMTWQPYGETSPGEIKAFINMRPQMHRGWTEAFDKLEGCL
ncbi:MAG: hypothetical protein CMN76_04045 [Spirochaetaceae bacterium]|nr:hypothetical protein [Spirochaetaceae bacterium]|tara:strand:+ start:272172 stop:273113 length:942 start_codon:yes stop_codon:yes gene_type:complete